MGPELASELGAPLQVHLGPQLDSVHPDHSSVRTNAYFMDREAGVPRITCLDLRDREYGSWNSHSGSQFQDPWTSLGGSKGGDSHLVALSAIAGLSWRSSGQPGLMWVGALGLLGKGLVGVRQGFFAHCALAELAY